MRVASFNLHAGVDGWGAATEALEHVVALRPDLLVCPEVWRGDDGEDFVTAIQDRLGLTGVFVDLARAERSSSEAKRRTWQPRWAHFTGERGLYFLEHRAFTKQQEASRAHQRLETGTWGLGLFTNLPIVSAEVRELGRLRRERVRRALIVTTLELDGQPFYALALHGAHLSHGSHILYRKVRAIVAELDPTRPIILAGDFNCWRPLLRVLLPGWRGLVRAKTWPVHFPHSQIDHILARGPWVVRSGGASNGGSDHLALCCDVDLG